MPAQTIDANRKLMSNGKSLSDHFWQRGQTGKSPVLQKNDLTPIFCAIFCSTGPAGTVPARR
jgi:hypothetical protein